MLSRTADSLFWLSRYVERADNTARIIDAASRLAAMPISYAGTSNEWESALAAAGALRAFYARARRRRPRRGHRFPRLLVRQPVEHQVAASRPRAHNGRAVRTALTVEMWEAINAAWLELKRFDGTKMDRADAERVPRPREGGLPALRRLRLPHDAAQRRLFLLAPRRLSRARRQHRPHPRREVSRAAARRRANVGGGLDYFQWSSILRSVSALTAYRWVYRESLKPWLIADLLVLNEQMPRSLASCYENLTAFLDELSPAYGRQGPAQRTARSIRTRLQNAEIADIFQKTGPARVPDRVHRRQRTPRRGHHRAVSDLSRHAPSTSVHETAYRYAHAGEPRDPGRCG